MYPYCLQCFATPGADGVCPRCGFANAGYVSPPGFLPPLTVLHGRYMVGKALGRGRFGVTYAGFDRTQQRRVAVKEYLPLFAPIGRKAEEDPDVLCFRDREPFENSRDRYLREAEVLTQLADVPGLAHVSDSFAENNTAYVIMEFIEGVSLREHVQSLPNASARPTMPEALDLLRPATDALSAIHARGFVHRSVDPDSIMMTPDGKTALLDLGAVLPVPDQREADLPLMVNRCAAIEQYKTKGRIGAWTDVYGLSATIWYLLSGSWADDVTDRMPDDAMPDKLRKVLDPTHANALLHGLAVQPEDRTQSVEALIRELQMPPRKRRRVHRLFGRH